MEAPEKIYVTECMLFATNPEITLPKNGKIEYTRTDALVEKVCDYFEPILTEYAGFYVGGEILQYFKDYYMEGE